MTKTSVRLIVVLACSAVAMSSGNVRAETTRRVTVVKPSAPVPGVAAPYKATVSNGNKLGKDEPTTYRPSGSGGTQTPINEKINSHRGEHQ